MPTRQQKTQGDSLFFPGRSDSYESQIKNKQYYSPTMFFVDIVQHNDLIIRVFII